MAEVQTGTTKSGELSQRFIEFIMMQAQNAALFLGQIPNPQTGKGEVNLDLAKIFIDQLAMIQEKTRGNLSNEEEQILRSTISNLQMVFVEVSQQAGGASPSTFKPVEPSEPVATEPEIEAPEAVQPESESRKKFTKSYGP
jgi:hypothetical protein